jgi:tight adherence protein C
MPTLIIALLAGLSATALGGAALSLQRSRREARLGRERALAGGGPAPAEASGDRLVATIGQLGGKVSRGRASRTLKEQLAAAGWHDPAAAAVYLGAKAALFVLGTVGLLLALLALDLPLALQLFASVFTGALLSFVPNMLVALRCARRRREVDRHLPDAVDLLEICVSSGMGLDAAWSAVSDQIRGVSETFADEMELTTLEISLGIPRADALRHMAARTGVDDLSSLVALLVQAERLGASIADALTTFARSLREIRSQRAEESAEKMSVKLMFPMVLFIFPSLLLVMVGPAVIQLVKVIGSR